MDFKNFENNTNRNSLTNMASSFVGGKFSRLRIAIFVIPILAAVNLFVAQKALDFELFKPESSLAAKRAALVVQLRSESLQGVESFNSRAIQKAREFQNDPDFKPLLLNRIKRPNRRNLLSLLALREIDNAAYRGMDNNLKAGILTDALKQASTFNDWARPDLYWNRPDNLLPTPVVAITELGPAAVPGLRALLIEKRNAPHWGSQENLPGGLEPYRVKDYALALLYRIEGSSPDSLFKTQAGRNRLIQGRL